jgi:uncharacterized protein (DUF1800 family)
MGIYLSSLRNRKATFDAKGVQLTQADENYAREVMQLFTIGLVQLQPDGTLMLDAAGQPIPTYNQAMISETAKILTGWTYAGHAANLTNETNFTNFYPPLNTKAIYPAPLPDTAPWLVPMSYYDNFHDKTEKRIVSLQQVPITQAQPTVVPAGRSGPEDLKILLDTLFAHPNVGPFLARQLIQRLVTSNPSAGYVYRVAQRFNNNGAGVRGDLGAVVRAILTDSTAAPGLNGQRIGEVLVSELTRGTVRGKTTGEDGYTVGAAYVFLPAPAPGLPEAPTRGWLQDAKLLASDGRVGDEFALDGDPGRRHERGRERSPLRAGRATM